MDQIPSPTIKAKDTWMSGPQLCQHLQFSPSTLRRLRKRGLPSIGSNRLRRYHLPSVILWLADRRFEVG